jgi:hypothetical protein
MQWTDDAVRIMLASVLKVEQNEGDEELVELGKKAALKRVSIKLSDNGLAKTTGTYAAWVSRQKGFPGADAGSTINKWWKVRRTSHMIRSHAHGDLILLPFLQLKEIYNAIYELSGKDRSGAPFQYRYDKGFGDLGSMQAEFDAFCDGRRYGDAGEQAFSAGIGQCNV